MCFQMEMLHNNGIITVSVCCCSGAKGERWVCREKKCEAECQLISNHWKDLKCQLMQLKQLKCWLCCLNPDFFSFCSAAVSSASVSQVFCKSWACLALTCALNSTENLKQAVNVTHYKVHPPGPHLKEDKGLGCSSQNHKITHLLCPQLRPWTQLQECVCVCVNLWVHVHSAPTPTLPNALLMINDRNENVHIRVSLAGATQR